MQARRSAILEVIPKFFRSGPAAPRFSKRGPVGVGSIDFFEAEVTVQTDSFPRILRESMRKLLAGTDGFWIKGLHFHPAQVSQEGSDVRLQYSIAAIAGCDGSFRRAEHQYWGAELISLLASRLTGLASDACNREFWPAIIRIVRLNRAPDQTQARAAYAEWLSRKKNKSSVRSGRNQSASPMPGQPRLFVGSDQPDRLRQAIVSFQMNPPLTPPVDLAEIDSEISEPPLQQRESPREKGRSTV